MSGVRKRGEDIRHFIITNIENNPYDISLLIENQFSISRQAAYKHLKRLIDENILTTTGTTRNKKYTLVENNWIYGYDLNNPLEEHVVWMKDIKHHLSMFKDNVINIWAYGFSEMFNNAIDHSEGTNISVHVKQTLASTEIMLMDNGVGIFKKIQKAFDLPDERIAVLELAKGKLTTDPSRHSGEGIFFTSRMFDYFDILSGGVFFTHKFNKKEDWILESQDTYGTSVWMKMSNFAERTTKDIFNRYSSGDNYGFNHTVVPVNLAKYTDDQLVSRSQAKRILSRIELFKHVIFDFSGVDSIGQAFADEIFRVFALEHPSIQLTEIHTNEDIRNMINRAKSNTLK